jgi:hypothetical protein
MTSISLDLLTPNLVCGKLISRCNFGLLPRWLWTRSRSLLLKKEKEIKFSVITWVCFDLLTPNLLCGSLGLPITYLGARSRSFAYNRIFSLLSIISVHFDLVIPVTSKIGHWKPDFVACDASCVLFMANEHFYSNFLLLL